MNPAVSVIVTTFNRRELLKETLESILAQTFSNFELIVVDNNSAYDFLSFIESFHDVRIKPFLNANHGIIAVNRNYGIKKATGEYIALCDDDDLWVPVKLEKQINFMQRNPSVGFCCTDISLIDQDSKDIITSKSVVRRLKFFLLSLNLLPAKYLLIFISYISNSSVLFKKKNIDNIGFLNEELSLKAIEDFEFWFRMSQKNRFCFINKKLVRYRVHTQQLSKVDKHTEKGRVMNVISVFWNKLNILQKIIFLIRKGSIDNV